MAIEWNKVTRLSQALAIVLGLLILALGFWLGMRYETANAPAGQAAPASTAGGVISNVSYACDGGKEVRALFYEDKVSLSLSDGRTFDLPHVISGSGARYANDDESVVFWEKGPTAFITEAGDKGSATTYANCTEAPLPE